MLELYESKKNKPTEIIPKTGESIGGPGLPIETRVANAAKNDDVILTFTGARIHIKKGTYTLEEITAELARQNNENIKHSQYVSAWELIKQFDSLNFDDAYAVEEWGTDVQMLNLNKLTDLPLTKEVIRKFNEKLKKHGYTCFDETQFPEN
jgi:hypothetical protein